MADQRYPVLELPTNIPVKVKVKYYPWTEGSVPWHKAQSKDYGKGPRWQWKFEILEHPEMNPGTVAIFFVSEQQQNRFIELNPSKADTIILERHEEGTKKVFRANLAKGAPQPQDGGGQPPAQQQLPTIPASRPVQQPRRDAPVPVTTAGGYEFMTRQFDAMKLIWENLRARGFGGEDCRSAAISLYIQWNKDGMPPMPGPLLSQSQPTDVERMAESTAKFHAATGHQEAPPAGADDDDGEIPF